MKKTISTTINGYPIDYTVEFSYNYNWLDLYVEELDKEFNVKNPKDNDIDLYNYALDQLTEEIEADLHLWLITNSNDAYFHSKGVKVFLNTKPYCVCENEAEAMKMALELNLEEYG